MTTRPWDPANCETHEYANPAGETVRFRTLKGTVGRMMPPIVVTTLPAPGKAGSRYIGALHAERAVAVPVVVPGPLDGRPDYREWGRILDPMKGQGTLTVVEGEWAGRQILCVYEAGLDDLAESNRSHYPGTLIFRAAYPYWVDSVESSVQVGEEGDPVLWFRFAGSFPAFPLLVGASNTFENFTVTNTGDVEAWPVVTVLGPATDVEVINVTTGVRWKVMGEIPEFSTLIVDTRPGQKLVRIDGENSYSSLTDTSYLWPLIGGNNQIQMSAVGTTDDTFIRFAWRNAWLAA